MVSTTPMTLFYHCLHTNHLPLIWTKFEDSHHNAKIIPPPLFLRNKIICYISPTIHKYENTWAIFTPQSTQNPPPPYPWLATLKIVKGMRVLFGTKATVYGKQSGSYGLQQIYTQPSPIKNDVSYMYELCLIFFLNSCLVFFFFLFICVY